MFSRKNNQIISGASLMEFALILSTVSFLLFAMNTYVKRGLQGRVADLSDYFIGREHAADMNPTARTDSRAESFSENRATQEGLVGGGTQIALADRTDSVFESEVRDEPGRPVPQNYIPAERGYVNVPARPSEENNSDVQGEIQRAANEQLGQRILALQAQAASLREQADSLRERAESLRAQGQELINKRVGCPHHHGGACRRARAKMRQTGQELLKQAGQTQQEAGQIDQQAEDILAQIDELQEEWQEGQDEILK